ncbi:hypothetical protein RBR11_10025 [Microbacterium sp. ASV81]|uniref:Uncharacterized protein n=1 Tax=Microbacterium capsulatum TaxID=3041921 RepID=A0ABU0XKM4_9MICO|nr:hypothetical protein [Microbacterium sp. ASV81]MDQ4214250.1 hypothetical protein [Microbacterium sp. ASV81]
MTTIVRNFSIPNDRPSAPMRGCRNRALPPFCRTCSARIAKTGLSSTSAIVDAMTSKVRVATYFAPSKAG